ncbi:MAG: hypothetical protein MUE45_06620, partial [Methanoregulaceae archaeon]|nr:hypothetical protein [Methanoregulaceae archaeon]
SVRMNKLSKTASIARFDTGSPYYYCGGNYKITDAPVDRPLGLIRLSHSSRSAFEWSILISD